MRDVVLRVVDFLENQKTVARDKLFYDLIYLVFCCQALEIIGDPTAVPVLINLLKIYGENRNLSDRYSLKAATDVLIKIGTEAVQPLIELLKSEYSETRKFAAYGLGKIGDRIAFSALEKVVRDPDRLVREAAGRALLQIDPEKAAKIVQGDTLTPRENSPTVYDRFSIEGDLKVIGQYYGSVDGLGSPSEYKFSVSLYKYVEKEINNFFSESGGLKEFFDPESENYDDFLVRLGLPQGLIDEMAKIDNHFLLCMCGEYLKWGYVKSISKRVYEIEDHEGWHFITRDIMCVYCENCKRYTGLEKVVDDAHPGYKDFYGSYLPRFPKPDELITEEELDEKEPILIRWEGLEL